MRSLAIGLALAASGACGDDNACLLVTVEWDQYTVPTDLDSLHFELSSDDSVVGEKTFPLTIDEVPPSLGLCQGPRTPNRCILVVYGVLGETLVTQSAPTAVAFEPGVRKLSLSLP